MSENQNQFSVGDRIVVRDPKSRWDEEPGVIMAQNPPSGEAEFYVVACAGWQPLVPADKVQRDAE